MHVEGSAGPLWKSVQAWTFQGTHSLPPLTSVPHTGKYVLFLERILIRTKTKLRTLWLKSSPCSLYRAKAGTHNKEAGRPRGRIVRNISDRAVAVAQWQSPCLARAKPWVWPWSPAPKKRFHIWIKLYECIYKFYYSKKSKKMRCTYVTLANPNPFTPK